MSVSTEMPIHQQQDPPAAASTASSRGLNVLCIDYGVGFGGATKSTGLMIRQLSHVRFHVLTSQDPEIRSTWYKDVPVTAFRRIISYHTRGRFAQWLEKHVRASFARTSAMKLFAAADAITTVVNTLRISLMIKYRRIDVVHLVNGYVPAEGLWASRITGVPTIVNMRGFWNGLDPLRPPTARRNTWLVGDSNAVTRSVPEHWCVSDRRETIYEAVDVRAIEKASDQRDSVRYRYRVPEDAVLFAILGRVVPWKGQLNFVRALIEAMEQDPRIYGMIVGDGPSPYMDDVARQVAGSSFADRFILTGYSPEVEPFYAAADVVVHASIEPEPCGMVVLEGMAARRPVIAARAGGPIELIRQGIDGMLVEPGDISA